MATSKSYRHAKSGVVREYPAAFGDRQRDLIEVPRGTKSLAYTPISPSAVAEYLEANAATQVEVDEDSASLDNSVKD